MENYKAFVREYSEVAKKILDKSAPLDGIKIIEKKLPYIYELSLNTKSYLEIINNLPIDKRKEKWFEVHKELTIITKGFNSWLNNCKEAGEYCDDAIENIIKVFTQFSYDIPKQINIAEMYESDDNDFLLTLKKIEIEKEHQLIPDFNDYKCIAMYKGARTKIFEGLKDRFPEKNLSLLIQLLQGTDMRGAKLIFHGEVKDLVEPFSAQHHKGNIISSYTTITNWIQKNFKYYNHESVKEINIETVKKYFRKS